MSWVLIMEFIVSRFRVLAGRPSRCRLLVVLMLSLAAAGCSGDRTAPGHVTGLNVRADSSTDTTVSLHWTNPTDADLTGVMIRRSEGATAPATATSGTLVMDLMDGVADIVDFGGVTAGTQYSYALFAHDSANNYAAAAVTYSTTRPPPHTTAPGPVTP
jgi:hypothetical protein